MEGDSVGGVGCSVGPVVGDRDSTGDRVGDIDGEIDGEVETACRAALAFSLRPLAWSMWLPAEVLDAGSVFDVVAVCDTVPVGSVGAASRAGRHDGSESSRAEKNRRHERSLTVKSGPGLRDCWIGLMAANRASNGGSTVAEGFYGALYGGWGRSGARRDGEREGASERERERDKRQREKEGGYGHWVRTQYAGLEAPRRLGIAKRGRTRIGGVPGGVDALAVAAALQHTTARSRARTSRPAGPAAAAADNVIVCVLVLNYAVARANNRKNHRSRNFKKGRRKPTAEAREDRAIERSGVRACDIEMWSERIGRRVRSQVSLMQGKSPKK